ncbi:DUF4158 domain-containing protein [Nocardia jiangxiensis]|uniref:DUF4158 domain-containing protein n=1 Tax=Nocardia jiangxiensis TaxID=282685 RepID=A0ABW6SEV4_9NOCA
MVGNKTGATRLGFSLLLKFFEIEASFPRGVDDILPAAVSNVAEQVKVDPGEFVKYRWDGRSVKYHQAQVREAFGSREFMRADETRLTVAGWGVPELRDEWLHEALRSPF